MTARSAPDWLVELQGRFGAVIRTPLDRSSGALRATVSANAPAALDDSLDGPRRPAAERLAVYNRQYWFRLFGVMQTAFPLTARLLGHWHSTTTRRAFSSLTRRTPGTSTGPPTASKTISTGRSAKET